MCYTYKRGEREGKEEEKKRKRGKEEKRERGREGERERGREFKDKDLKESHPS